MMSQDEPGVTSPDGGQLISSVDLMYDIYRYAG